MKYRVLAMIFIACGIAGALLIGSLLRSEGKWGNPEFMGEFWDGMRIFAAIGLFLGVSVIKACPKLKQAPQNMKAIVLFPVFLYWIPIGTAGFLAARIADNLGIVDRSQELSFIVGGCALVSLLLVHWDQDFEEHAPYMSLVGGSGADEGQSGEPCWDYHPDPKDSKKPFSSPDKRVRLD